MSLFSLVRRRWLRRVGCAAVVCCCAGAPGATPKPKPATKQAVQLTQWEQAERGRETFETTPVSRRTKADYATVMDSFRAVYHERPSDIHAASAVYSVAELLAEQGRDLKDAHSSKAAIGQYEFLRTQYPGSSLRVAALLAQGKIYENDLKDAASAHERYALLLKQYPRSAQAEEARAGIGGLDGKSKRVENAEMKSAETRVPDQKPAAPASDGPSTLAAMPVTRDPKVSGSTAGLAAQTGAADEAANEAQLSAATTAPEVAKPVHHGPLAKVSGIRHWSTPTYTRVAIDLGDDVTYEAARVPNPDRIYFDLHGTKLAHDLVGKTFAVTDDGFLKKIRAAQYSNDMTRVVLDVSDVTEYSAFLLPNPYRLIIDIHGGSAAAGASVAATDASVPKVPAPRAAATGNATAAKPVPNTVATTSSNAAVEVASLSAQPGRVEATEKPTSQPISAVVKTPDDVPADTDAATSTKKSVRKGSKNSDVAVAAVPARAAVPTADGERSLVRALGLKIGRIVIDPGHGGHDSGTLGVDGIEEKDVVLDVALRLGKLLHERLGEEIIYTRSDDTFIPLETRTAIANKAQADLFLSIHANSSPDESARGVETYYLNFTSDPTALDVAARENAVSGQSIHQLSDLVKKITLKDKIAESREFAGDVEQGLYGGLQKGNGGLKDRGVKKAPFVVLIGANMPSILSEISFVTNGKDASQLQKPEYRQRVAESLYKGVAKYVAGLSSVKTPAARVRGN
jgi:N-acetylmuramoyl-L-alanine amidase